MDKQHTPGPWTHGHQENSDGSGWRFVCTNTHKFGTDEAEIARLVHTDNTEANAWLIASAPELLEALQWIAERVCDTASATTCNVARDKARAAIAKATGQQTTEAQ